MNRLILIAPGFLLLGACQKEGNPPQTAVPIPAPFTCPRVSTVYTGAITQGTSDGTINGYNSQKNIQIIATNANVIAHERDIVQISLCTGPVCASAPYINYAVGPNQVHFINAKEAGFTDYAIETLVCQ